MRKYLMIAAIAAVCLQGQVNAQVMPERERAALRDSILDERFKMLLPGLMDETGIDMWLVIAREYNEDPVIRTMLPSTWLNQAAKPSETRH